MDAVIICRFALGRVFVIDADMFQRAALIVEIVNALGISGNNRHYVKVDHFSLPYYYMLAH
jgi:hypothetical protein